VSKAKHRSVVAREKRAFFDSVLPAPKAACVTHRRLARARPTRRESSASVILRTSRPGPSGRGPRPKGGHCGRRRGRSTRSAFATLFQFTFLVGRENLVEPGSNVGVQVIELLLFVFLSGVTRRGQTAGALTGRPAPRPPRYGLHDPGRPGRARPDRLALVRRPRSAIRAPAAARRTRAFGPPRPRSPGRHRQGHVRRSSGPPCGRSSSS